MSKHIKITWNTGNGEKTIIFGTNTNMEISSLNTKVSLTGNSEVEYYTNLGTNDHHDKMVQTIDQVLGNIMELQYLPIAEEMDPEIVAVSEALGRLLQNTNIGHTFDLPPDGEGVDNMIADAEPDQQEPEDLEPDPSATTGHPEGDNERSLVAVFDKHTADIIEHVSQYISLIESFLQTCIDPLKEEMAQNHKSDDESVVHNYDNLPPW